MAAAQAARLYDCIGRLQASTTGSFYGDSFVKPFLVVRAAMFARMPVLLDRSIWQI